MAFACPTPKCDNSVSTDDKYCRICGISLYASMCHTCSIKLPTGYTRCVVCYDKLIINLQREKHNLQLRLGMGDEPPRGLCPIND